MQETLTYRERSQAFLIKAWEELEVEDFEQASEKGWGAAALMVKAVAQARGKRHRAHYHLTDIVEELVDETGDEQLRRLYDAANALHGNFYENRFRARGVRGRLRDVEAFVDKMSRILDAENS